MAQLGCHTWPGGFLCRHRCFGAFPLFSSFSWAEAWRGALHLYQAVCDSTVGSPSRNCNGASLARPGQGGEDRQRRQHPDILHLWQERERQQWSHGLGKQPRYGMGQGDLLPATLEAMGLVQWLRVPVPCFAP